ncbi:hypothetical protein TI39_contig2409g00001, partial [Zymoseptoria brevis]
GANKVAILTDKHPIVISEPEERADSADSKGSILVPNSLYFRGVYPYADAYLDNIS